MIHHLLIIVLVTFCVKFSCGNHYNVLNVNSNAKEDEIKKSYRELAKKYHPDKNKNDPNAQDKFIAIGTAYEILSNSQKRREYDLSQQHPTSRGDRHMHTHSFHRHRNPNRRGQSFKFESTFELPPIVSMILGLMLFALPLTMMCAPLFFIWLILWICGYRKPSSDTDEDTNTDAVKEKLSSHWKHDYLPLLTRRGMQTDRRIIIAALSSNAEVLTALRESKARYSRDPVFFARCNPSSCSHAVIALCKQGKRFCLLPDSDSNYSDNMTLWIDKILNGEIKWENMDAPHAPDIQLS